MHPTCEKIDLNHESVLVVSCLPAIGLTHQSLLYVFRVTRIQEKVYIGGQSFRGCVMSYAW